MFVMYCLTYIINSIFPEKSSKTPCFSLFEKEDQVISNCQQLHNSVHKHKNEEHLMNIVAFKQNEMHSNYIENSKLLSVKSSNANCAHSFQKYEESKLKIKIDQETESILRQKKSEVLPKIDNKKLILQKSVNKIFQNLIEKHDLFKHEKSEIFKTGIIVRLKNCPDKCLVVRNGKMEKLK